MVPPRKVAYCSVKNYCVRRGNKPLRGELRNKNHCRCRRSVWRYTAEESRRCVWETGHEWRWIIKTLLLLRHNGESILNPTKFITYNIIIVFSPPPSHYGRYNVFRLLLLLLAFFFLFFFPRAELSLYMYNNNNNST